MAVDGTRSDLRTTAVASVSAQYQTAVHELKLSGGELEAAKTRARQAQVHVENLEAMVAGQQARVDALAVRLGPDAIKALKVGD